MVLTQQSPVKAIRINKGHTRLRLKQQFWADGILAEVFLVQVCGAGRALCWVLSQGLCMSPAPRKLLGLINYYQGLTKVTPF